MTKFDDSIAKIKELAARKIAESKPKKRAEVSKQLSLELWPDAVRGVPNAVLRNALFGVASKRKIHKKRTVIVSTAEHEVRFKGETFNQTDLDDFEGMLHLARLQPLGTRVEFSVHEFLKMLGRGTGKSQHEQFKEKIARLIGGVIEVTWVKDQKTYIGTLVQDAYRDEKTGRYVVMLSEKMLQLYQGGYTLIDWEQRKALGKDNLAKWLHGHYATHATPYPYKVETLKALSGSDIDRLGDFRKALRKALDKLVSIGSIESWDIDPGNDLVTVMRTPSPSQRKHIARSKR